MSTLDKSYSNIINEMDKIKTTYNSKDDIKEINESIKSNMKVINKLSKDTELIKKRLDGLKLSKSFFSSILNRKK